MKKASFLIAIMLMVVSFVSAQTGGIKGIIIDGSTNQPMEYVNVVLKKGNPLTLFKGTISDSKGGYVLGKIPDGNYQLELSFIGYTTYQKAITIQNKIVNIGSITLQVNSKTLHEVQVEAQAPQMQLDIDKKVFTVNQSIASAGASAAEMLQNIPSVSVDVNGNVSLRNNSNVEIWINGKPAGITSDNEGDILQEMPAGSIEKVEVITNPSAKYSAEGSAGILNLILKDSAKPGYYGSISGGFSVPDRGKVGYNGGFNFNYTSPKVDAYASIGRRDMKFSGGGWSNRYVLNPANGDTLSSLKQTSTADRHFSGTFMRAGLNYHLNKMNSIGFSGFMMFGNGVMSNINDNQTFSATNDLMGQYFRNTATGGNRKMYHIDLDYEHKFDNNGSNLTSSLSFSSHPSSMENNYSQWITPNAITSTQQETTKGKSPQAEFKLDYTKLFTQNSKLQAGFDGNYQEQYSDVKGVTNGVPDPSITNLFDYFERDYAAYTTYGNKWGKFSTQIGLRGEYSYINFSTGQQDYTIHYLQPFPSVFLDYAIDPNNEFQLNYTRRLNRPRGRSINPFVNISDSTNWSFGNPNLAPEYINSFEINYLKSWTSHTLSASLFYHYTTNGIQSVQWLQNGIMMNTYMNGSKTLAGGLETILRDNFFRFFNLTTTVDLYYNKLFASQFDQDNQIINIPEQSSFTWNLKSIANVMLPANLSAQITGSYTAPYYISQGKNLGSYEIDLGIRQMLFRKKLILNLNIRDLFNSDRSKIETWGSNYKQESLNYFNGRMVMFNITYNFGNSHPSRNGKKPETNNTNNTNNMDNMMDGM
ncbi:outer membrane beta-barrel family protein [Microbacter margulisiae]|uniref:Outer membrane receptor protein involved in Fe transport n=1 Tax=Microbacter margulisiae TaxID=1350067 RepID=A0A7W5DNN9_9PORP|nr:outer membrane beta-barrel family protein [Microbacter margulisiae]MBB3186157.1 outer membrane receptor protein involved in Fe transport [Microbacter margulisiae]